MSDAIIKLQDVNKWYGQFHVLRNINLDVAPGERIVVCGPSGSGKSTMIRCINRLEEHQKGHIIVDGTELTNDLKHIETIRKDVGMVFQHFNLFPHLTVLENLTLGPMWVLKKPRAEAEATARALLASVGLGDRADAYPAQLSGGQRQRVGICRALAMQPRYLLLDEVTSALDPEMTAEVLAILAKLAAEGTTMLFVTHEIEFARQISNRIVFLDKGKLLVDLPTADFFAAGGGMANPRIAQFLSKMRKD